jgi:hypothetical protein
MRLASEGIEVTIGCDHFCLRPSLRAALRLERRYKGFGKLRDAILTGRLETIIELIAESSDCSRSEVVKALQAAPLSAVIALQLQFLMHVLALAGIDPGAPQSERESAPITYAEFHDKLFRRATGWLGWTPEAAWNATPAEIITAYEGLLEKLRAIHGGTDNTPEHREGPDNSPLDREGLDRLRAA